MTCPVASPPAAAGGVHAVHLLEPRDSHWLVCVRGRDGDRQTESGTRHTVRLKHTSLSATYRCSAVAMDTVPSLLSLGGYGGMGLERSEERGSGSGCCLCVIFIPVQPRGAPLFPTSAAIPPSSPSSSSSSNFHADPRALVAFICICSSLSSSLSRSLSLAPSLSFSHSVFAQLLPSVWLADPGRLCFPASQRAVGRQKVSFETV